MLHTVSRSLSLSLSPSQSPRLFLVFCLSLSISLSYCFASEEVDNTMPGSIVRHVAVYFTLSALGSFIACGLNFEDKGSKLYCGRVRSRGSWTDRPCTNQAALHVRAQTCRALVHFDRQSGATLIFARTGPTQLPSMCSRTRHVATKDQMRLSVEPIHRGRVILWRLLLIPVLFRLCLPFAPSARAD
jgi:hypothetical protein